MDWVVILFTSGVTVLTALLASAWPVFKRGKTRVGSRQWTSASTRRAGDLLIIGDGEQTGERRFDTFLVSCFGSAALFLSAIGIYGLLHHAVVQRTNEIGVRMALVLRHGLALVGAGAALGLGAAYLSSQLLSKLLYEVAPTVPLTFGISVLVLIAVAGVACWALARRAARIDPLLALRQD